jgi:hypothetical protein
VNRPDVAAANRNHYGVGVCALAAAALGFFVSTGASAATSCVPGPGDRPEGLQGSVTAAERNVAGGYQGAWCGARLVGANNLFDRGSYGSTARIGHCVYSSMRDPSDLTAPTTGTAVIDNSVPSNPQIVGMLRTPAMIRAYSALYIESGKLLGAYKDFGPNGTNPVDMYDVSGDCLHPVFLSTISVAGGNHDGWLTPDAKTYYGIPFGGVRLLSGTAAAPVVNPARIDLHVTDFSDPASPKSMFTWNRLQMPPEVQALPTHPLASTNFHDVSTNKAGTRLYMALYGGNNSLGGNNNNPIPEQNQGCANGMVILDSTDVQNRVPNAKLKFISFTSWCDAKQQIDPDYGDGSTASGHATEYIVHQNGKEYVLTTDESGGGLDGGPAGMCAQRTYARMIDITDELHPQVVGTFKTDVNKPANCAAILAADTNGGMVHYLGIDDRFHARLVFYAAANSGVRIVDWADPTSPKEIAYYHAANDTKTAAGETDFTRPDIKYDADNCLMYTGWNQGGLKTLELTNPVYNPCMRRSVSGFGTFADTVGGKGVGKYVVSAARNGTGMIGNLQISHPAAGVNIVINQLTALESVRDACAPVQAVANAVEFEGSGTYNGAAATFRVCVQDNTQAGTPHVLNVACTAGCTYKSGGAVASGNIIVKQN